MIGSGRIITLSICTLSRSSWNSRNVGLREYLWAIDSLRLAWYYENVEGSTEHP
jgi:hypothetical protein